MTASLKRLSICPCGFLCLVEWILLGSEYAIDPEDTHRTSTMRHGGCYAYIRNILVAQASQFLPARLPCGAAAPLTPCVRRVTRCAKHAKSGRITNNIPTPCARQASETQPYFPCGEIGYARSARLCRIPAQGGVGRSCLLEGRPKVVPAPGAARGANACASVGVRSLPCHRRQMWHVSRWAGSRAVLDDAVRQRNDGGVRAGDARV